jgi:phosphatidylinositol alpha-1,6-mannosyltransferase
MSSASPEILLISELFPPVIGGSAELLANVYGRLSHTDVTVLTNASPASTDRGETGGMRRVHTRIDGRLRGLRSRREIEQIWRLSRAILSHSRTKRRLVVHTARPQPEGVPALVASALRRARLPFVCWVHGEDVSVALLSREYSWIVHRVCRGAEVVIANSDFSARIVAGLGVSKARIRTVHPGVDPTRFRPDVAAGSGREGFVPGGPVLLTVGRLQRRKGHDLTIRALRGLTHEFPQIRYVIAGDGEERGNLEALAAECGVREHVLFLGSVANDRLPALYSACDVFVMPTRADGADVEGFGIVYLEAAASAKPAVGGRNGGVPEAIADGESGLLVSGTDAAELAQCLALLLRSDELRQRMGAAGRQRVCESFTWDRAARDVESINDELVKQRFVLVEDRLAIGL